MKRFMWLLTLGLLFTNNHSPAAETVTDLIEKMPPVAITLPKQVPSIMAYNPAWDKAERQFSNTIGMLPLKHGTIEKVPGKKTKYPREIIVVQDIRIGKDAQKIMQSALQAFISEKKTALKMLRAKWDEKEVMATTPFMISAGQSNDPRKNMAFLNTQISALKNRVFNKKLEAFDLKVQMFNEGNMSMASYLEILTQMKDTSLGPKVKHPQIDYFRKIHQMEANIDFPTVERERAQVVRRLVYRLGGPEQKDLRRMIMAYRLGDVSHKDFYTFLQTACAKTGIKFQSYSTLNNYAQYVFLSDRLEQMKFLTELKQLEEHRYNGLIIKPSERALIQQSSSVNAIAKIVDMTSPSEEWAWSKNSQQ